MSLSMAFSQNINYYNIDNEGFADVKIDNFTFTCRVAGLNNTGDPIILLHGFPETSRMWYDLIKTLDGNNYKVIAPDQRGYSRNARPLKVDDYKIDKLSLDIIHLADEYGFEKFHLVGHDWGSAVGWHIASKYPDRLLTFSALSVPHLDAFFDAIVNDKIQKKKSQYIHFFIKPFFPEFYFKIFNYRYLKKLWVESSHIEKEKYLDIFKQKDALKATLNWYRSNFGNQKKKIGNIYVPTLIIYGINDMSVGENSVDNSKKFLKKDYKIKKLEAGHWLIQESFEATSSSILNHLLYQF